MNFKGNPFSLPTSPFLSPTDKSQVKIEVIYKLQSSHPHENPNSDQNIQFLYNESSESLFAINQHRDYSLKYSIFRFHSVLSFSRLGAYKVFTEGQSNKSFYETITDAGGECINPLLKGFNVALVSYGLKGKQLSKAILTNKRKRKNSSFIWPKIKSG